MGPGLLSDTFIFERPLQQLLYIDTGTEGLVRINHHVLLARGRRGYLADDIAVLIDPLETEAHLARPWLYGSADDMDVILRNLPHLCLLCTLLRMSDWLSMTMFCFISFTVYSCSPKRSS